MTKVYVVGVGMTAFSKPRGERTYDELGLEAAIKSLLDAGLSYDDVQQAYAGYVYGDSTCGQRTLYPLGMTQIPVINTNNNCSTGSTALWLAGNAIRSGSAQCVMALGFEQMERGSLGSKFDDRPNPLEKSVEMMNETRGFESAPVAPQLFGNAGTEYIEKYGATPEHFGKIAEKNHRHSTKNPYSQFRDVYSLEQIMSSQKIHGPLTKLQCCPTSDGAACAILCNEEFVMKHNLQNQAIEVAAQVLATDSQNLFNESAIELVGADMTRRAAQAAYKDAGVTANDIQAVELHDCFSANELVTYDALGLCKPGEAHKLIDTGDVTYGGKYVVNPSGGLISKGHPLGATGLAQCCELVWQLRGWADNRQIPGVKFALAHNVGLGGAVVISIYKKPSFYKEGGDDGRKRLGGNPATAVLPVSQKDYEQVVSKTHGAPFIRASL
ncbi:propanoyl-CoA C-acyltransferase [Malassezia sp. CBS 17886]|nr:propanoyl-CoA C-acyltransferase [Malassezia sp. CBS 17886]